MGYQVLRVLSRIFRKKEWDILDGNYQRSLKRGILKGDEITLSWVQDHNTRFYCLLKESGADDERIGDICYYCTKISKDDVTEVLREDLKKIREEMEQLVEMLKCRLEKEYLQSDI